MAALRNPKAEEDAKKIVRMWLKKGRKAANIIINQIVEREKLTGAEHVMLSGRVFEIVRSLPLSKKLKIKER